MSEKVGLENFTGGVVSRNLTTVRTLQWASEYDGCVSNGYQESTARINYRGQEIDKVTYSFSVKPYAWPNQFAPQVLSVNRRPVDALALDGTVAFQGGLALDHTQANTGPPPFPRHGNLYGTHNDWIFDPCLRASAFWSGYVILINPPWNTFPQLWSDGEMQWMTRMESA